MEKPREATEQKNEQVTGTSANEGIVETRGRQAGITQRSSDRSQRNARKRKTEITRGGEEYPIKGAQKQARNQGEMRPR